MARQGLDFRWQVNTNLGASNLPDELHGKTWNIFFRALNRTVRDADVLARRVLRERMGVTNQWIKRNGWRVRKASNKARKIQAGFVMRGRPSNVGSKVFKASIPKRGGRGRVKGVLTSKAWGQQKNYPGGFLMQGRYGGQFALKRTGRGRSALKPIYGPWTPREYDRKPRGGVRVRVMVEKFAARRMGGEVARLVNLELGKMARKRNAQRMRDIRRG